VQDIINCGNVLLRDIAENVVQSLEGQSADLTFLECLRDRIELTQIGEMICVTELVLISALEMEQAECPSADACHLERLRPSLEVARVFADILRVVLEEIMTQIRQDDLCQEEPGDECQFNFDCGIDEICQNGACVPSGGNDNDNSNSNGNENENLNGNENDNGNGNDNGNANENGSQGTEAQIEFYAVYDHLVDTENDEMNISELAMSNDGERLIFSGTDISTSDEVLYTINADGSGKTQIILPDLEGRYISEVVIDGDGSRAFLRAQAPGTTDRLYKVEGGAVTQLLDSTDSDPDLSTIEQIQCTADGEHVYFVDNGGFSSDIWQIDQSGSGLTKVVEDTGVAFGGNDGYEVEYFAISGDGATLLFVLAGYWLEGVIQYQSELFVLDAGGTSQLTSDGATVTKSNVDMSGDGSTIVYTGNSTWYAIHPDGTGLTELGAASANFGGLDLTYDGTQMFYDDDAADGGRLANTDGSGHLNLFPSWSVATITLDVTWEASISDDGTRVAFIFQYSSWPFLESIHVGHLNDPDAVADAPSIDSITLNPGIMPVDDPAATLTLTAQISDPQGLSDIIRTSTDELLHGEFKTSPDLPVTFSHAVHDDGASPDLTVGDGLFTTLGLVGAAIGVESEMRIRVGALDNDGLVVIADVLLPIGE